MSSPKYSTRIYPTAENDLREIKDYFQNKLNTSHTNLFQKFYDAIDLLESNPFIHPLLDDTYLSKLGYRMIPIDNFLMFYIVEDEVIQIHRFLYGRRDYLLIL